MNSMTGADTASTTGTGEMYSSKGTKITAEQIDFTTGVGA